MSFTPLKCVWILLVNLIGSWEMCCCFVTIFSDQHLTPQVNLFFHANWINVCLNLTWIVLNKPSNIFLLDFFLAIGFFWEFVPDIFWYEPPNYAIQHIFLQPSISQTWNIFVPRFPLLFHQILHIKTIRHGTPCILWL